VRVRDVKLCLKVVEPEVEAEGGMGFDVAGPCELMCHRTDKGRVVYDQDRLYLSVVVG
jgi:hypothetical protein